MKRKPNPKPYAYNITKLLEKLGVDPKAIVFAATHHQWGCRPWKLRPMLRIVIVRTKDTEYKLHYQGRAITDLFVNPIANRKD